jgi:hemoglobin
MRRTLFERCGGFARISKIVMDFYNKVLDSPVLASYFAHTDMKRQIDHQTKFIATLMGGPASYTNEHLERVHSHLNITESAFQELMGMMRETLEDHNLEEDDIQLVVGEMINRKNYIVSKK